MEFVRLFESIKINKLTISNRIVMPAMALFYANDYTFTDRYKAFYRERARGGVGLMIIGPMAIDKVGSNPLMPGLFDDRYIGPIREFVDELHRETKARIGVQFMQQGRYASSRLTGMAPIAPSPLAIPLNGEVPREMTGDDIVEVEDAFAKAAVRAKAAGFDYVELMAGGGYLIGEFLSPVTNHRTDEYGGTLDRRMRFGLEVIEKVRGALGKGFLFGIRVSGHDFVKGGNTNEESAIFCSEAEDAGADCINVTGGWHETDVPQITSDVPPGAFVYLARGIKEKVGVPVFASNRLGNPVVAENVLRSGSADMICWGRPLLADPELPLKVQAGRLKEVVPCIGCNQGCFDSLAAGLSVCCTLNPRVGRERETEIRKAAKNKSIFVAGGGPAGMEFALVAAQRGHDVTLYEKDSRLGGQINLIGALPGKEVFQEVVRSFTGRLEAAGVRVNLNSSLTRGMIEENRPDVVVVASGAVPATVPFEGAHRPHVVSAWDVINGSVSDIGRHVVIVGGSATGCETALLVARLGTPDPEVSAFLLFHGADEPGRIARLLHDAGRKITVIEQVGRLAANVGPSTRWPLLKSLRLMRVDLRPGTKLVEIGQNAVIAETEAGRESIRADTVIIAVGSRLVNGLADEIGPDLSEVITIGDAKEPRKIIDAVREGFDEALRA